MNDLPQELLDEMSGQLKDTRKYTAHDHVLAKINNSPDGASVNDLLVYLYYAQEKLTKREYLYHVLTRLRKQGFIETTDMSNAHGKALNFITKAGMAIARPLVDIPGDEE